MNNHEINNNTELNTEEKAIIRCAKRLCDSYRKIDERSSRNYYLKYKADKRLTQKNKEFMEECSLIMQDFGLDVYYKAMTSLNNVLCQK